MSKNLKLIFLGILNIIIFGFLDYLIIYENTINSEESLIIPSQLPREKISFEKQILAKLNLEQKIGQLFSIGFEGEYLTPETENLIKTMHPGGIILLERNIKDEDQLKELINSLQAIALEDTGLPLFIAVDQEGGLISRIGWIEKTPQFEIKNIEQAYQIGLNRGRQLKNLGINLNLAPLLDLVHPADFIYDRSFKKSQEKIGELGKAIVLGQKSSGIFTAIKHFPGYGDISFNPEENLAKLEKIPETPQFKVAWEAVPEIIMTSNVIYSEIDNLIPFTFSEKGIQFLKNEIEGNYLIMSDDLAQNSLLNKFSLRDIVASPFKAGVDILIFSGWRINVAKGISAFRAAVKNGEIREEQIDQPVLKIIKLKQKLLK